MKYSFSVLLALLCCLTAGAYDFMAGDIAYNINSDGTSVTAEKGDDTSYISLSGAITIPETVTYSGTTYSVTSIGVGAFYDCFGLTSVTIPNSVTSIGDDAFMRCSGLTSVTIPNSVTSIGNYAFYGCRGLTSVTIGNSVTSIGDWAFYDCSGLTSVTIPNSVTSIGEGAFAYCSGLTSIKVETGNTNYDSRDNCNAIIKTATNSLITGCKTTTIPNSVTSIGYAAFYKCSGLTSVTIPNSVTFIGNEAFSGCSGLTSVTIPNSVTDIGESAFYFCSGLTSVTIPNSVTSIGGSAFSCCSGLTSVTIPNSVTSIGRYAFEYCSGLTNIYSKILNPNNVTLGNRVFDNVDKSSCILTVPAVSLNLYKAAAQWEDFLNIYPMVSSISLNKTQLILDKGHTETLTATVLPNDATYKTLNWTSSNTSVATVDQNGKVTAKAAGTATITATATGGSGVSASCLVTVLPDYSLMISPNVAHVRGTEQRTYELAINMSNRQAISGLQFNMKLPTGVSLATDSYGDYDIWLDNDRKARNHTWGVEPQTNNSYFVLISSPTNRTFSGNTGAVLHLTVQIDKFHLSIGDYAITLSDVVMAEADETQHTATSSQSIVRLAYLVGDANADVEVDVADYVVTANYLLGRDTGSHFFTDAANAAYDNSTINVTDLVAITNIALELREKEIKPGVEGYQLAPAVTIPGAGYAVTAEVTGKNADMTVVSLDVDNDEPVAAMQLDLDLPEGVTLEAAEVTERAHGMTASCGSSPEGKARVVLSSFADYDIEAGRGSVLTLTLRGKANSGDLLRIIDMVMSERNLVEHGAMDNVTLDLNRVTAVNTAHYDRVNIYGRDGAVVIESPVDGAAKLVRLNGASQTVTVTAGRNVYPVDATRGDIIIATFNGTTTKLQF